jgi:hypothetical protein
MGGPHLDHADTWPAPRAAALLRSLPPTARIFDWADRLGPDVRAHYWEKAPVFLIQEDADRERAARTLVELGHATNALGLLTIAIQHGNPPDPDLVAEALSKATVDFPASNLPMFTYYVTSLLTYLDTQPQTSRQRLAQLEWRYLPLLEPRERPTRVLHQELARDPEFFVEIIETIYIPRTRRGRPGTADHRRATPEGNPQLPAARILAHDTRQPQRTRGSRWAGLRRAPAFR